MAEQPDGKGKKERKAIDVGEGIQLSAGLRDNGTLCATLPECDAVLFTHRAVAIFRVCVCEHAPSCFCE